MIENVETDCYLPYEVGGDTGGGRGGVTQGGDVKHTGKRNENDQRIFWGQETKIETSTRICIYLGRVCVCVCVCVYIYMCVSVCFVCLCVYLFVCVCRSRGVGKEKRGRVTLIHESCCREN